MVFNRQRRQKLVLLGLMVCGVASAFGQGRTASPDSAQWTWPAIHAAILAGNPSLNAARLETEALSLRGAQVGVLPDPRVMLTYMPYPLFTARGKQRSQWRVEQAIPYPGKQGLKQDIAEWSADVALHETAAYERDLLLEARQAYYELYRIQRLEALVKSFQQRLADFEEGASVQYEVGRGAQQAILKAQLERNALHQKLISLRLRRTSVVQTLNGLTRHTLLESQLPEIVVGEPPVPDFDVERLVDYALASRPEVDALVAAERRAAAQIDLARKEFKPDFGVNITYFDVGTADVPPTASGRDALALGVSMNIPLQRNRLRAQLQEAQVRKNQVDERKEALALRFETHIRDVAGQLVYEYEQLRTFREALLPQAEAAMEATLSSYTTGRTDFMDLLDAERTLYALHVGYEDALARYLNATALLERALGVDSLDELESR